MRKRSAGRVDETSRQAAAGVIRRTSFVAAGLAVVLSPIPFADEVALLPVYAWLTVRVARARGTSPLAVPWRPLGKTALLGLAVRAGVGAPVAAIPGVAAAVNAATAFALTRAYGACVDRLCCDPSAPIALDLFEAARQGRTQSVAPPESPADSSQMPASGSTSETRRAV